MRDRPAATVTLLVNLTLPSTKLTFGVLSYDPLKEMLGFDPRAALAPLLRAEPYIRTAGGAAIEVFPLAIAAGARARAGTVTASRPLRADGCWSRPAVSSSWDRSRSPTTTASTVCPWPG